MNSVDRASSAPGTDPDQPPEANRQSDRTESQRPVWRVAIVGGGISGLAAAHRLVETRDHSGQSLRLTLFEAGSRIGGVIHTRTIDDFLVETGPDMFITDKPAAVSLCQRLGLEDRLIRTDDRFRRSLVLRNGRPEPVPDGFTLLAPARIWPVLTSPIFSPWGKLRMGLEVLIPKRKDQTDESLGSFVRRRFGREALERLIQPLVGGIYTADPEKLSLRATLPRFLEMEARHGSLLLAAKQGQRSKPQQNQSGARYGLFTTLQGGLCELVDRLQARVADWTTIRLNTSIESIERSDESGFRLTTQSGSTEQFDAVIVAVPAYHAAGLISSVDQELAVTLQSIDYASSAVVLSGHRLCDIRHPLDAFGLVVPILEARRILAVSFASRKFSGRAADGHVILRTFVGGALQSDLLQQADKQIQLLVRSELENILGVTGRELFSEVVRWDRAMPQYHVGHLQLVKRIYERLTAQPNLGIAGNALLGVGIPDCVDSGEAAAEKLLVDLQRNRA